MSGLRLLSSTCIASSSLPAPIRSGFVRTPIVRTPSLSALLARSRMSTVAMSTLDEMTARITVRSCAMYWSRSWSTSAITVSDWPSTAVRTMPVQVDHREVRHVRRLEFDHDLVLRLEGGARSACQQKRLGELLDLLTELLGIGDGAGRFWLLSRPRGGGEAFAFQLVDTFFIRSSVAHLVTRPEPRGKGTPLIASSTEDFPDGDWSPMTRNLRMSLGRSFSMPVPLSSFIKSM